MSAKQPVFAGGEQLNLIPHFSPKNGYYFRLIALKDWQLP